MVNRNKGYILKFLLILVYFSVTSCGFKIADQSNVNFSIREINTIGDKRVNFKIKNELLYNTNKNEQNELIVNLNTKKIRQIKEKNIKNEIKKYELILNVDVEFRGMNDLVKKHFNVKTSGDYDVADRYSQTLTNEKKLIDILVEKIVSEIINNLAIRNDL